MAEQNRRSMILIMIALALALIVGAWFIFSFLSKEDAQNTENTAQGDAVKVLKIKNLATENLSFFPLNSGEKDVLQKLESNAQYQKLNLDLDTSIDIRNNPGNPYPFAAE